MSDYECPREQRLSSSSSFTTPSTVPAPCLSYTASSTGSDTLRSWEGMSHFSLRHLLRRHGPLRETLPMTIPNRQLLVHEYISRRTLRFVLVFELCEKLIMLTSRLRESSGFCLTWPAATYRYNELELQKPTPNRRSISLFLAGVRWRRLERRLGSVGFDSSAKWWCSILMASWEGGLLSRRC